MNKNKIGVVFPGSFLGFYAHGGFYKALVESGVKGDCFAGVSAGALLANVGAEGYPIKKFEDTISGIRSFDIFNLNNNPLRGIFNFQKIKTILDKEFDKKKKKNIIIISTSKDGKKVFTEKDSASRGICASMSVRGLFEKFEGEYSDGVYSDNFGISELVDREPSLEVLFIHNIKGGLLAGDEKEYKSQLDYALEKGLRIVEIVTPFRFVNPFTLNGGMNVFSNTYEVSREQLKEAELL